ncbi:MAG: hypothetical protein WCL49_08345 [bacterium]
MRKLISHFQLDNVPVPVGPSWQNPEAEEAHCRQAKPPATNPENTI